MPVYQPLIPTGSVPFNQDYLNVQNNFNQNNVAFGGDHIPLTDTTGLPPGGKTGCHTAIHFNPLSTPTTNMPNNYPPNGYIATAGFGQLFGVLSNDGIATDNILMALSGGGLVQQLTRNISPSAIANGYTFIPGGILVQWGINNNAISSQVESSLTQNFNISFPTNVFFVVGSPLYSASNYPGSQLSINIRKSSITGSGPFPNFQYQPYTNSSDYIGFVWFAIGK
jgi:hypothetical protein